MLSAQACRQGAWAESLQALQLEPLAVHSPMTGADNAYKVRNKLQLGTYTAGAEPPQKHTSTHWHAAALLSWQTTRSHT